MENLAQMRCTGCRDGQPLTDVQIAELLPHVPAWDVVVRDGIKRLERRFDFPDFARALVFTNQVGEAADAEGHHPAILTEWGGVTVTWWTHEVKGLHLNDFIMSTKTDRLFSSDLG